jgi:NAD(P)-dependent dehydrogenase (short-subunit alcohol dehydrogenase family)
MSEANKKFTVNNLFNVEGWVAVVSGGGTGSVNTLSDNLHYNTSRLCRIGLMISQAFANNGARVYITGRRPDILQTAAKTWGSSLSHPKGRIIPIECDVTSKPSIERLVEEVQQKEDHVDLLVNNAGISRGTSEVEKGDEDGTALAKELYAEDLSLWEDVYRTNVIGCVSIVNLI